MNREQRRALEDVIEDLQAILEDDAVDHEVFPTWIEIANGELGEREIRGDEHNPRVVEYHATTGLSADDDETPWCSSFVNWCFKEAGIAGTNSARARSWLDWGKGIDAPVPGCVVVFSRPPKPASGHVAFFVGRGGGGDTVRVLGGNQGNSVSVKAYPLGRVIGYRLPEAT